MELDNYRQQIDRINTRIIELLSQRMVITAQVAEYKKQNQIKVVDLEREKQMLQNISQQSNAANLPVDMVLDIFQCILSATHKQEQKIIQS